MEGWLTVKTSVEMKVRIGGGTMTQGLGWERGWKLLTVFVSAKISNDEWEVTTKRTGDKHLDRKSGGFVVILYPDVLGMGYDNFHCAMLGNCGLRTFQGLGQQVKFIN